ncbi:MAG: hypothetical protein Unbinned8261contig1001_36 [Prokaryotic dsDNA virus sp.]|nr:MAG: hypothetical protein Unbinned8261contig1001_36 [Prokaryotic dsDNA virus sp.]|tara:strand:- start:1559 stop:1714 length:156 start_codon:yes stop_codon:yes gene_type:complete
MTEIKNVYKDIENKQFMQEFINHMVDTFDEDKLKELYKFCVDQTYKGVKND